mmetsp:Transcript_13981/g.29475  ORF Transcript_13981/g.29475 Transcript_13981/m.29475 type:complete len:227 (+) Transcript_13981:654-1334(+)
MLSDATTFPSAATTPSRLRSLLGRWRQTFCRMRQPSRLIPWWVRKVRIIRFVTAATCLALASFELVIVSLEATEQAATRQVESEAISASYCFVLLTLALELTFSLLLSFSFFISSRRTGTASQRVSRIFPGAVLSTPITCGINKTKTSIERRAVLIFWFRTTPGSGPFGPAVPPHNIMGQISSMACSLTIIVLTTDQRAFGENDSSLSLLVLVLEEEDDKVEVATT